jgi:hypothetical protein
MAQALGRLWLTIANILNAINRVANRLKMMLAELEHRNSLPKRECLVFCDHGFLALVKASRDDPEFHAKISGDRET